MFFLIITPFPQRTFFLNGLRAHILTKYLHMLLFFIFPLVILNNSIQLVKIIVPICEIITCNRCVLTNNGYKLCFSGKSQIKYQIDLFILKKKLVYLKKRESILKLNKNDKQFSYHNFFFSNISPLKYVILIFS